MNEFLTCELSQQNVILRYGLVAARRRRRQMSKCMKGIGEIVRFEPLLKEGSELELRRESAIRFS